MNKNRNGEAREIVEQLRVLLPLAENLGSNPSTQLTTMQSYNFRGSGALALFA